MIIKRLKFSLFLFALVACLSCENGLKVNPADALQTIDESMLEPVDISFDEIEGFLSDNVTIEPLANEYIHKAVQALSPKQQQVIQKMVQLVELYALSPARSHRQRFIVGFEEPWLKAAEQQWHRQLHLSVPSEYGRVNQHWL